MADNYLTKLVNQVSAVSPTTDALASKVIFNTSWRDADMETSRSLYNKEGRPKVVIDKYFIDISNEFQLAAQTGTGKTMVETWLGKNIAETILHNVLANVSSSSTGDVRSELKRVQGSIFAALVGAAEKGVTGTAGISNEKAKEFAAEVIFKYIYNDESNLDDPNSLSKDEEQLYNTDDYIVQSSKIFRRSQISRDVLAVDRTVEQVRKGIDVLPEVDGLLSKARTEEERSRVIGREAQTETYVNRPGVYPFISLLETAKKEIVIDTFQFQNKTISDYLYSVTEKRMLESARSGNFDFQLKLRLATPRTARTAPSQGSSASENLAGASGAAKDEASYAILGPNMLEMQKFNELRLRVINQLRNEAGVTPPDGGWDAWEPIKFEAQDRRHHAKLYFTDAVAAIGTTNLTSPMGDNIQQAGSNFETMRFIHNRLGDTDSETLRRSGADSVDARETLLYKQVQDLMARRYAETDDQPGGRSVFMNRAREAHSQGSSASENLAGAGNSSDTRANIGLSGDIFTHLETTLGFASRAENDKTKFFAILDQLMLLQYDTDIYAEAAKGEFGAEDELFQSRAAQSGRHTKFKQLQTQLFDLLINDRAEVVVDVRNYRDQILNPTFEKLLKDNGTTLDTIRIEAFKKSGRDIGVFVGEGSIAEKVARLASYGITDSNQVTQLLAIASGNIRSTVVARQHVKSFALFDYSVENAPQAISTYMGSSNLGPYAMAMGLADDYNVSEEYGVLFSKFGNDNRGGNALTEEQEQEELHISGRHFFTTWRQLDSKNIEDPNSRKLRKTTTMWEGQVDSEALATFRERLMDFAASTGLDKSGFKVEYGYSGSDGTGQRATHLIVSMNVDSMSGMGQGYIAGGGANSSTGAIQFEVTTLKGSNRTGGEGAVYFIGQNRLVSNSVFVNSSGQDIPMAFGSDRDPNDPRVKMLAHGESQQMSSMDTAISLFGTLTSEIIYRTVVSNPRQAFENLTFDEQNRAFADYLNALAPGGIGIDGLLGSDVISLSQLSQLGGTEEQRNKVLARLGENKTKLIEVVGLMETRFSANDNKYLQIAAKLGGADMDMTNLENPRVKAVDKLRESLGNLVKINDEIERAILANDIPLALEKRNEATRLLAGTADGANISIFSQFREMMAQAEGNNLGALFPELALDIMSQQQDFIYNSRLKKDIHGVQNTLLDSFLTPAQDRTYGGPQASYRTLVFGFDASVRYAQARQRAAYNGGGEPNKDDIGNLGLYARMVPYAYNPTTFLGDTYIRSIASKSSINENFDGTAMTFMGMDAMPVGDVMKMEIIEALGMGSVTRREHIDLVEARMRSKLALVGMNTTEIEAIILSMRAKVGAAFGDSINIQTGQIEQSSTNTILNFTTGGKDKASQLPQRLKNALGSRPLYAMSMEAQVSTDSARLLAKRLNLSRELREGLITQQQYDSHRLGPAIDDKEYNQLRDALPNMRQVADKYLGIGKYEGDSDALKTRVTNQINAQKQDLIDRYTSGRLKSKTIFDESMARLERGLLTMVTEDLELAAVFGGRIRKVLDSAAAEWLEEQRREIEEVLGEGSTRDENSVAGELLRAYALRADLSSQGQGSLIGGADRGGKKSVVLVQMAGAYSDYGVANPDFGNQYDADKNLVVHGVVEAGVETSKERIKGSMLAVNPHEASDQSAPSSSSNTPKKSKVIGGGYTSRFVVDTTLPGVTTPSSPIAADTRSGVAFIDSLQFTDGSLPNRRQVIDADRLTEIKLQQPTIDNLTKGSGKTEVEILQNRIEKFLNKVDTPIVKEQNIYAFGDPQRQVRQDEITFKYVEEVNAQRAVIYKEAVKLLDQVNNALVYLEHYSGYDPDGELRLFYKQYQEVLQTALINQGLVITKAGTYKTGGRATYEMTNLQVAGAKGTNRISSTTVISEGVDRTTYKHKTTSTPVAEDSLDSDLESTVKKQGQRGQTEPKLYVAMGDDIRWNAEAGRYMVYRDNKPRTDILVSRTKQYTILGGIIENFQVSDGVSVANVEGQAYIREGEDSHSILLNVNRRQGGSPETNQMTWNITRIDAVRAGGGRRSESLAGGLLKAVFTYAAGQNVKLNVADEDNEYRSYFESLVWQMNQRKGGAFSGADLELEQVSAVISPANIKAFFYSHGSVILRDGDMMDSLFKLDAGGDAPSGYSRALDPGEIAQRAASSSKRMAAALLLSFGSDFASGSKGRGQSLKMQVWDAALRGELGTYYQSIAALATLQQRGNTTEAIKVFFKNASFNAVSAPYLTAFSADELENALSGKDSKGEFVTKVKSLVELDSVDQNKEYINLSDIRQRQSALIVSAIDFYQQFSEGYENKGGVRIATDISFTPGDENNVLKMLATIGGVDKAKLDAIAASGLDNEKTQQELQAMLEGLVSRVPMLRMYMDWASSGSKDPIGSHPKGNLEFQHTLHPMLMQAEAYKQGGQLENLARVVANVFAAVTSSSATQYYGLAEDSLPTVVNSQGVRVLKHKDVLSEFSRSPFAKARAIGIYGSGSHPEEYRVLQKRYKEIAEASVDKHGKLRKGELLLAMEEADDTLSNDKVNSLLQELDELNSKLDTLSRKYGLEENKAAGSDLAKAVVGAMVHEQEVVFIPGMQLKTMPDGSRVLTKSDRGGFLSYILSGEQLNIMGTQFGGYVDQLVKYTEIMLEANSPGTRLSYLLDALARSPEGIVMTPEDEAIIGRYVAAAGDMMTELAKSTSGMRAQGGVGGKTRLDGAVTVPVGSFLVPGDSVVMAEAVLSRTGGEIAGSKHAALIEINYALDKLYTKQAEIESEIKKGYFQTQEAEASYIIAQEQKVFLQAQREALIEGISEAGTRKLVWGSKKSEEIKAKLIDIKSEPDLDIRLGRLTELRQEVKGWLDFTESEQKLFNSSSEPGDSFSNLAVQRELQLWHSNLLLSEEEVNSLRGDTTRARNAHSQGSSASEYPSGAMNRGQRLLELERIAAYESNPLMIKGYQIGSKYQSQSETNYQVTANLLEGRLRGNMPQASLDFGQVESIGKELSASKKKERQTEFMLHKVAQASAEFDRAADAMTKGLGSHWTEEAMKGVNNLKEGLAQLELRLKAGANPLDVARDFHALMASEDTRAVQSAVSFRSAPFGSTEFMTQAVRIQRLSAMNQQAAQSGNMSGMLMLQMDEERNRTATFMAPVSKRTIALGDFDGDSFTTIWNYIVQTQEQIVRKEDLNFKLRQDIKYLEEERKQLEQELLINSDPAKLTELTVLNAKITQLEQNYANRQYEITKDIGKVNDINNEVTVRATSAARKDLAEYMGIDERFFIGKDERDSKNRVGWADKSADVDVLHSYLEFGRNLFGGIDKQAPNIEKARQGLSALVDIQKTGAELALVTDSDIQDRASIALAAQRALPIADRNNDLIKLYEVIESNSDVAKGLAAQVRGFGQREARRALSQGSSLSENLEGAIRESSEGTRDEATKDLALRSFTSELHNQLLGNQATQKLVAQGSGMTMSPSTFDILSYSLGVAGGDILGKTFNSMIGTLYQDAPIITMGHVLTKNEDTQAAVKAHITKLAQEGKLSQEWINNAGGIAGAADYFLDQIKSAQAQAEGLQGFMKDTGQLLRDSIKFKDGQGDMLDKLNVVGEQYRKAIESGDTEAANKLIVDIAKNIGPGPGLLAYMQLDSLVNLKDVSITDDILRSKFDIDSNSDYYTRIESRLKENGIQLGLDKNTINRQVAEYKTRQDLVNLVTAFRFEKSVAAAGSSLNYVSDGWAAKLASGETTEDIDTVKSKYQLTEIDPTTNKVIKSTPTTQDAAAASTSPSGSALSQNATRAGVKGNAKYREALASFLGTTVYDEAEYDKRVKEFIKDKGSDALLLFDEVFNQTERQTQPIFGTEGERLKNFVSQDSTRRSTAQAVSGQMSEAELLRASTRSGDVMDTFMQLMSQGKLNADSLPMLSNMVMAEFEEDIAAGKEVSSRDVIEKLLESRETGATSDEGKNAASMLNELYKLDDAETKTDRTKAGDFAYDIDGKSAGYKTITEFIDEGVEASYMSQQSRMVEHLIKSSQEQGNQPFNTYEDIADAAGYTGAAREKFIERMHNMDIQLGQSYRNRDIAYTANPHSTISKNSVAGRFSEGAVKFLKNAEVANQMDFFLPLILTVAGNAIASGSIDEDMFQSFAGSSLVALAYSRPGLSTPGYLGTMATKRSILAAGMGTGFKLRMALNESEGDIGQALVTTATRELVFNTTTAVIAPKITDFISHRILGASPYALDQDRYIASKTAASTLAGAFISAAMGMMISNTVVNLSQNALIPGIGLIDAALMGASERNQRIRESQLEAQEGIGISVFNDEDGQEVEAGVVFDESYFTDEPSEAVRAALESTNISEDGEGNIVVGPMSVGLEA